VNTAEVPLGRENQAWYSDSLPGLEDDLPVRDEVAISIFSGQE
jgi:hypothetical protein